MAKRILPTSCPICHLPMQTVTMHCAACDLKIEGSFAQPLLGKLSAEDQKFLEEYLLAGFSIKTLEQGSEMGYAAIRSRLDKLIEKYKQLKNMDAQKRAVLEQLRAGEISVTQAKDKLARLGGE